GVVYLAQIRDGIVRPYISEIGVVTDTDKWNAVYTACERGYNYYVEGDIDNSDSTYTIIAYERTADRKKAITNITAVSEETVRSLEEEHVVDPSSKSEDGVTAASITISRARYVRVSSTPVSAEEPYYLYMTKNRAAGNPISMIYVGSSEQTENLFFGMWANSYFFTPGETSAYSYGMNEDLYASLWNDQTVCAKIPVQYLDSYRSANISAGTAASEDAQSETDVLPASPAPDQEVALTSDASADDQGQVTEQATEPSADPDPVIADPETTAAPVGEEPDETVGVEDEETDMISEQATEEPDETETTAPDKPEADPDDGEAKYINLTVLTPRDGLPSSVGRIIGMRDPANINFVERTQRSDRTNKFQASVFSGKTGIALIAGGAVILAAAAFVIFKKRSGKKAPEATEKTKKAR
ncbi:MAG: hypothetical protein IJU94_05935, partial [Clostridia bacterium]|nr:hypothetical protein [Clostridia bacterium]